MHTKRFIIIFAIFAAGAFMRTGFASSLADLMIVSHRTDLNQVVHITLYPTGQEVHVLFKRIQPDLWIASLKPGTYRITFRIPQNQTRDFIITLSPGEESVIIDPARSDKPSGTSTITVHGSDISLTSLRRSTSNLHIIDQQTLQTIPATRRLSVQDLLAESVPGAVRSHDDIAHVRGAEIAIGYNINGSSFLTATNPVFGLGPDPAIFRSLNVRTGAYDASTGWRFGGILESTPRSGLGAKGWFGSVSLGGGNFATQNHRLSIGTGGRTWGIFGQMSYLDTQAYFQPRARTVHHDHGRVFRGFLRTDWKPTASTGLGLNIFYNRGNLQIPVDPVLPHIEQERVVEEAGFLLESDLLFGSWVTEIRAGIMHLTDHHRAFESDHASTLTRRRDTIGTLDFSMSRTLNQQLKWEWGFQFRILDLNETGHFDLLATSESPSEHHDTELKSLDAVHEPADLPNEPVQLHHTGYLSGLYSNLIFSPIPLVKITAGLRFDYLNLIDTRNEWSPRLNILIHPPASPFSILLSYNRLVWAPPVENYLLSSQLPGALPVRPTTSNVWEVGIRYVTSHLIARTNIYYRTSDNVYHTINLAPLDVYLFQNFEHETLKAVETSLTLREVLPRTRFTINYTLGWQTFRAPTVGGFAPDPDAPSVEFAAPMDQRHTITFLGHWQPIDAVETNLSLTWASGLPAHEHEAMGGHHDGEPMNMNGAHESRLPSYLLVNIGVGLHLPIRTRTEIRFEVENLFDRVVPITQQSLFTPTQYLSRRKFLVTLHTVW